MSSSNFFESGERVRIAHQGNPQSSSLQADMDAKKAILSQNINGSLNHTMARPPRTTGPGLKYGEKKPRKQKGSDDDDEDYVDEEMPSEDEEDFDMNGEDDDDDYEEESSRKRKTPAKKKGPTIRENYSREDSETPEPEMKRVRTLSDSSDDEWMTKPRLNGSVSPKNVMRTQLAKRSAVSRRKVIIDDESDEDFINDKDSDKESNKASDKGSGEEEEPERPSKPPALVVEEKPKRKSMNRMKIGKKMRMTSTLMETRHLLMTIEERRAKRGETKNQKECREFFNSTTKEILLQQSRVNDKIADFFIANRPFETYGGMMTVMKGVTRGTNAIEAYMEYLEKRGILSRILDDCKDHAKTVAKDFERCTEGPLELKLLKEGCTLHDYQLVGVKWLIMMNNKELNAILGDEMGLGKTIQIVAFLSYLKQIGKTGPHLIVVPSSTIENWIGEFHKWCPSLKLLTYYGSQDERKHLRHRVKKQKDHTDVILTTYNMVTSKSDDKKFFKNFSLNYVIYDEGHMLKNCDSERYRGLMKVKGKRKILLTGTPLQNNLIELISLMYFVLFKVFNKYCEDITHLLQHFKQLGPALESKDKAMYQQDRIEEAKSILQPYILRRLKNQVLSSLPPKSEQIIEVEMKKPQKQLYDDIVDVLQRSEEAGDSYGSLMRLRQAANHPLLRRSEYTDQKLDKIAKQLCLREKSYADKKWQHVAEDLAWLSDIKIHQLCERFRCTSKFLLNEELALKSGKCEQLDKMLPEIQEKGDKVLIFSQFTSMLDILEVYLNIRGYSYKRLDGQTPVLDRQEMINEFNLSKDLFVFLLSTKAGGLGINLTSANHIIIHDIDFNPYNDKQAEDRCHRMGQEKDVHVTRLVSKATVEIGMLALAKKKLQLEKQVTDGVKGQLDEDALRELKEEEGGDKIEGKDLSKLLSSAINGRYDDVDDSGDSNGAEIKDEPTTSTSA
uniref:SWI/SNF-related matrix-associated actin-dependent regulator of chromatin subfamily A containing DEAD/H box 1 homolog n=1 Tax=Caenorhabditis tropicalis TaxID=1561998 RepID=A0A1I7TMF0_9PELO